MPKQQFDHLIVKKKEVKKILMYCNSHVFLDKRNILHLIFEMFRVREWMNNGVNC